MNEATTPPEPVSGPTAASGGPRRLLRRARGERMVFGVCAGIARYFDIDPTLVRVGVVLVGLIPPLGGTMLLAYIAMAIIVPQEDAPGGAGREQVRDNLSSLRSDLSALAETVRAKVTGEPTTADGEGRAGDAMGEAAPEEKRAA